MGACYVGRVGGLAVALGIGAAVAVGQAGIADADTTGAVSGQTASVASKRPAAVRRPVVVKPAAESAVAPQQVAVQRVTPHRVAVPPRSTSRVSAPARTADHPGIWTVLAAVRREFFNTSPTITPVIYGQTTSGTGQAVVTGNFGAADADGDTLYYTCLLYTSDAADE